MARPDKIEAVSELKEAIEGNTVSILASYQGISVAEVTELRAKLRESGIKFKVFKNTLAKRALDELGLSDAVQFIDGPTVWAFSEDPVAPAKILKDYGKDVEEIAMRGGILEGKPVSREQLESLASLPPREQLLAQLVGTIAMPLRNYLGTLQAVPRNYVNVLDRIREQKEETAA